MSAFPPSANTSFKEWWFWHSWVLVGAMKRTKLSSVFVGFAVKRLTAHQVDPHVSNGHEFQGSRSLLSLFGDQDRRGMSCVYYWLEDDGEPETVESTVSWYDSRRGQPKRSSEWRLYYSAEAEELVQQRASVGDLAVIGLGHDGTVRVMLAAADSTWESRLRILFDLPEGTGSLFDVIEVPSGSEIGLDEDLLLAALDVASPVSEADLVEQIVRQIRERYRVVRDGVEKFPSTEVMSREARAAFEGPSAPDDPDGFLYGVMEWEMQIFKVYERELVGSEIQKGFLTAAGKPDVEKFFAVGKSMGQARFSRAGYAFQHHIAHLLRESGVVFSPQCLTEGKKKPDFVFPGGWLYADPDFPDKWLNMLGVKTTGKDRWRQLLNEANRIPRKHYLTLEAPISGDQLSEMEDEGILPVIPSPRHRLFPTKDHGRLMSVRTFLDFILEIQADVESAGWSLMPPQDIRKSRKKRV